MSGIRWFALSAAVNAACWLALFLGPGNVIFGAVMFIPWSASTLFTLLLALNGLCFGVRLAVSGSLRETFLRWMTQRCEVHARPSRIKIAKLELACGYTPSEPPVLTSSLEWYADDRLTDCGHDWCRRRRGLA